jgi:hypothetical protein
MTLKRKCAQRSWDREDGGGSAIGLGFFIFSADLAATVAFYNNRRQESSGILCGKKRPLT